MLKALSAFPSLIGSSKTIGCIVLPFIYNKVSIPHRKFKNYSCWDFNNIGGVFPSLIGSSKTMALLALVADTYSVSIPHRKFKNLPFRERDFIKHYMFPSLIGSSKTIVPSAICLLIACFHPS